MGTVEKIVAGMFFLVLVFLLLTRSAGFDEVANALAKLNVSVLGTLQGRDVSLGDVQVRAIY